MVDLHGPRRVGRVVDISLAQITRLQHQLRKPTFRPRNEVAVWIGSDHGKIDPVEVVEIDPQFLARLELHGIPRRQPAVIWGVQFSVVSESVEQTSGVLEAPASHLVMS